MNTKSEEGTATVEAALGICSVLVVFSLVLCGISAVITQLRCTDAAAEIARLAARGDEDALAGRGGEILPEGAEFEVTEHEGGISVAVSALPVGGLVVGRLRAEAYAVLEPGVNASVVRNRGTGRGEGGG